MGRTKVNHVFSCRHYTGTDRHLGPLELTRRTKVLVWDDDIPVTEDMIPLPNPENHNGSSYSAQVPTISPHASIASMPPLPTQPRRTRSQSISGFPPPIRRLSTDMTGLSRPVSFSAKFQRVHPATTGVTVLEHMERLDAVEAGLKRLGVDDTVAEEEGEDDEEVDVGESSSSAPQPSQALLGMPSSAPATQTSFLAASPPLSREPSGEGALLTPSAPSERLAAVPEGEDGDGDVGAGLSMSFTEADLAALSKSTSHIEAPQSTLHGRYASYEAHREVFDNLEWMPGDSAESPKTRMMVVEVSCRFAHFSLREVRMLICASPYLAFGNRRRQTALLVLVRTVMGIFGEDLDHLFCSTAVRMLCIYILSTGRSLLHSCTSWPNAGFIPIYA